MVADEPGADQGGGQAPEARGAPEVRAGNAPAPKTAGDLKADPGGLMVQAAVAVTVMLLAFLKSFIKCIYRDRKRDDSGRKRSKTPPKSYSTARRSRSLSR